MTLPPRDQQQRKQYASPIRRNLRATGKVRLGMDPTRDLVIVEGTLGLEVPGPKPDVVSGQRVDQRTDLLLGGAFRRWVCRL